MSKNTNLYFGYQDHGLDGPSASHLSNLEDEDRLLELIEVLAENRRWREFVADEGYDPDDEDTWAPEWTNPSARQENPGGDY